MAKKAQDGEGTWGRDGIYHTWKLAGSKSKGTKTIVRKAKDKATLRRKVEEVKEKLKMSGPSRTAVGTFGRCLDDYIKANLGSIIDGVISPQPGISVGYLKDRLSDAKYLTTLLGSVQLFDVDHSHVQKIIHDCGRSPSACQKRVALFYRVLPPRIRSVVKEEAKDNRIRVPQPPPADERVLSFAEADTITLHLNEEAATRNRWQFLFLLNTGLRIGECNALTLFDILRSDEVNVDKQGGFEPHRWDEKLEQWEYEWVVGDTKTKRKRKVPLNPMALHAVRMQREMIAREKALLGDAYLDHGLLFPSSIGTPLREDNISRALDAVCLQLGIENFTLHDFRRTYATMVAHQLGEGAAKVVANLIGDSVEVASKYYLMSHKLTSQEEIKAILIGSPSIPKKPNEKASI